MALQCQAVRKSFGAHEVLRGVDLSLPRSSITGLIGPSGGGKSVLLKIFGQVLEADSGTCELNGIQEEEIALMFQEGALFDSLTVYDNIAFPLVRGKVPSAGLPIRIQEEIRPKILNVLEHVGLLKAAFKMPGQLSGGMRRRVSLARAVVGRPKLLFLDDPTCGLDPVASSVIMNLIRDLHAEYRPTLLIVSHDLRRLLPIVENVAALFDGKICFHAPVSDIARSASSAVQEFVSCRYDLQMDSHNEAATTHSE